MKTNLYALMLVLALFAGLLGGIISGRLLTDNAGYFQKKPDPHEFFETKEVRLIGDNGRTLVILGGRAGAEPFLPEEPALRFFDKDGDLRILIGLVPGDVPHIGVLDRNRNLIWEAP